MLQKFTDLTKKHEALNQNIIDLVSVFNGADTMYNNFDKKDYEQLEQKIEAIEEREQLISWRFDRTAIIKGFDNKINKIKNDRQLEHDDELQTLFLS